ncbi:hypothetical protein Tco_0672745 [Tanacetum coccineum]
MSLLMSYHGCLSSMTSSTESLDSGELSSRDGTYYSYVPNIPDLGVQQGVNFISGTPGYSTALSPFASQFGMFGDAHPSTSRNQDDINED